MRWPINKRPSETSGQFLPILKLRFPTPHRFRRKQTQQYNSSAEIRARIPDRSKATAGDPAKQQRLAPEQLRPEDLQRQWQSKLDKGKMSGEVSFPAAEAASPTP